MYLWSTIGPSATYVLMVHYRSISNICTCGPVQVCQQHIYLRSSIGPSVTPLLRNRGRAVVRLAISGPSHSGWATRRWQGGGKPASLLQTYVWRAAVGPLTHCLLGYLVFKYKWQVINCLFKLLPSKLDYHFYQINLIYYLLRSTDTVGYISVG
jgi:hypothetical protein